MKKLNLWLFMSLFVAAFTLTACGDDDNSKPGSLVGTVWYEDGSSKPDSHWFRIWDFGTDGVALFGILEKDKSSGDWSKRILHSWKYQVKGDQFSAVNEYDVQISGTYTIEGDVLKLTMNGEAQKMIRLTGEILDKYKGAKLTAK